MKSAHSIGQRVDGTTILVVEDDPLILEVEKGILKLAGYRVLAAGDGIEGAVLFARNFEEIDLLLTDISMPGMRGIELAAFARKIRSNVKILFASGSIQLEDAEAADQAEGVGYLPKPFAPKELLEAVQQLMDRKRSVMPTMKVAAPIRAIVA